MSGFAVFSFSKGSLPPNKGPRNNLPDRPELFDKLRYRDVMPAVSLFGEDAFVGTEVDLITLEGHEEAVRQLGLTALESISVIVNRLDRSFKKEHLPYPELLPPTINENSTRSLAFRKIRSHIEVLEPLALNIPTILPASIEEAQNFLKEHSAATVVLKPNNGSNSKNINFVKREELGQFLRDNPEILGEYLLQPAFDFSIGFPETLKPYDAQSREAFEGWSVSGETKELRVYGFHSPAGTEVFPAARAIKGGDNWFFVDPGSLPARVLEGTRQAIAKTAGSSEAKAVFGTVDYGYGTDGIMPADWYAIELNARMPYLVGYDEHPGVADNLRELFADQISATASRSSGLN